MMIGGRRKQVQGKKKAPSSIPGRKKKSQGRSACVDWREGEGLDKTDEARKGILRKGQNTFEAYEIGLMGPKSKARLLDEGGN